MLEAKGYQSSSGPWGLNSFIAFYRKMLEGEMIWSRDELAGEVHIMIVCGIHHMNSDFYPLVSE